MIFYYIRKFHTFSLSYIKDFSIIIQILSQHLSNFYILRLAYLFINAIFIRIDCLHFAHNGNEFMIIAMR